MTARQPRRTRRRAVPRSALPRPSTVARESERDTDEVEEAREASPRRLAALHHRQHHVTKDYSYIHRDLLTIVGVGMAAIAFIVGMSFVVA